MYTYRLTIELNDSKIVMFIKSENELKLWTDAMAYLVKSTQIVQQIIEENKQEEKNKMDHFEM